MVKVPFESLDEGPCPTVGLRCVNRGSIDRQGHPADKVWPLTGRIGGPVVTDPPRSSPSAGPRTREKYQWFQTFASSKTTLLQQGDPRDLFFSPSVQCVPQRLSRAILLKPDRYCNSRSRILNRGTFAVESGMTASPTSAADNDSSSDLLPGSRPSVYQGGESRATSESSHPLQVLPRTG